jgi:hypothetical protein
VAFVGVFLAPFNAAERGVCMRKQGPHCLSPDLSGRVCGTAAGNRCARVAVGQVEGGLSFASFSLAVKENEGDQADIEVRQDLFLFWFFSFCVKLKNQNKRIM